MLCQQALDLTKHRKIISLTVSEQQAVNACLLFLDNHRKFIGSSCTTKLL